jgi:hypothetical protein
MSSTSFPAYFHAIIHNFTKEALPQAQANMSFLHDGEITILNNIFGI